MGSRRDKQEKEADFNLKLTSASSLRSRSDIDELAPPQYGARTTFFFDGRKGDTRRRREGEEKSNPQYLTEIGKVDTCRL
jgi:hypothetical protein